MLASSGSVESGREHLFMRLSPASVGSTRISLGNGRMINADVNRLDHVILPRRLLWRPKTSTSAIEKKPPYALTRRGLEFSSVIVPVPSERSPYIGRRESHVLSPPALLSKPCYLKNHTSGRPLPGVRSSQPLITLVGTLCSFTLTTTTPGPSPSGRPCRSRTCCPPTP